MCSYEHDGTLWWCIAHFSLLDNGRVYVFGNGDWGQLGIGNPKNFHEKAEDKTPIVTVPTVLPKLLDSKV